jgi:hypothetical protein
MGQATQVRLGVRVVSDCVAGEEAARVGGVVNCDVEHSAWFRAKNGKDRTRYLLNTLDSMAVNPYDSTAYGRCRCQTVSLQSTMDAPLLQ